MTVKTRSGLGLDDVKPPQIDPPDDDERARRELENDDKSARIEAYRNKVSLRAEFAYKLYRLMALWLIGIGLVISLQMFKWAPRLVGFGFAGLNDTVLLALIGGTTANVLGLFHFVAKYYFHPGDD